MNLYQFYKNKKVLITGNTGFKGSWLSQWLLKMDARVYGISDSIPTNPSMFEELKLEERIHHQYIDIRNQHEVEKAILKIKPDYIFHMAAQAIVADSYSDPLATLSINAMGTAHVLEALRKMEHECIAIFITSDKCYENVEQVWGYRENDRLGGKDVYSCSKGTAELIIHSYYESFLRNKSNIRIASARAGNVIGGGDFANSRIVPDCVRAWSQNEKVVIRSPYATRPWQHVLEPLSGYLRLAAKLREDNSLDGETFNFGPLNEQNKTVLDLIDKLSYYWGFDSQEEAYDYVKSRKMKEAGLLKLNCDKALHYLEWHAVLSYTQTIKLVSDWYANFYSGSQEMNEFTFEQISTFEMRAAKHKFSWAASEVVQY
jgi:CDP-glucose 4,6-dehydratase